MYFKFTTKSRFFDEINNWMWGWPNYQSDLIERETEPRMS